MLSFLGPYKYAILGGIVAVIFGVGFYRGYVYEHEKALVLQAQQEKAAAEAYRKQVEMFDEISKALEEEKQNIKVKYVTIEKEVERIVDRPIYLRACFDDDGLRLANSALTKGPYSSEPASTVPRINPHP